MAATNSPLISGMHHCRCRQGFNSSFLFFERLPDRLGRDALDEAQLDRLTGEHPECPVVVAVGDRAAGDGDEVGLLRAGERLAVAGLPLLAEHRVHPALGEAGAHAHGGVAADVEGAAHLGQAPTLA
jgi:hypothetical protein